MSLLNRSPGAFIVFANLVVYGVIGVEIWMWTVATTAAAAVTLVLIAACAGVICRVTVTLMDDAAGDSAGATAPPWAGWARTLTPGAPQRSSRPQSL